MEHLKNKLNRDIYNIIYNYLDQSESSLIKLINKTKYKRKFYLENINILDLITKSIQFGYYGVYIPNSRKNCLNNANKYIEKYKLNYILTKRGEYSTYFYIKTEKIVNIDCLDIIKYDLILKN